jgi:hypothetical protein
VVLSVWSVNPPSSAAEATRAPAVEEVNSAEFRGGPLPAGFSPLTLVGLVTDGRWRVPLVDSY